MEIKGIDVSAYNRVTSYALSKKEAREEARKVLETLNHRKLDFPVFYDMECYNNVLDTANLPYDYWLAAYPYNDRGKIVESLRPPVGIGWQYSSKGSVPGIEGYVDLDVFYKRCAV